MSRGSCVYKFTISLEGAPEIVERTVQVGEKITIKAGKKVKRFEVSDSSIATVTKKGKKLIVEGVTPGTVTVTAYGKKNKVLGYWLIQVE